MDRSPDCLRQAAGDLEVARDLIAAGHYEWAAFVSQQATEKAAKALVQSRHGSVRGHSVAGILRQIPSLDVPEEVLEAAHELDQIYITSRYPNGFASGAPIDHFTARKGNQFLSYARLVYEFCRSATPRSE